MEHSVRACTELPDPMTSVGLTARRLLLQNWADSRISDFLLMWNQRLGLQTIYGNIEPKNIPVLFSKGRPFDADHIVARSKFLYNSSMAGEIKMHLQEGVKSFFDASCDDPARFDEECFRRHLPNINANFRYWPKHLNRADNNTSVESKMLYESIRENCKEHPLSEHFVQEDEESKKRPWEWSSIPLDNYKDWCSLPPKEWSADSINTFIRLLLEREHFLYGNAYEFLTMKPKGDFDHKQIIKSEND